jgi:hypothetical protein
LHKNENETKIEKNKFYADQTIGNSRVIDHNMIKLKQNQWIKKLKEEKFDFINESMVSRKKFRGFLRAIGVGGINLTNLIKCPILEQSLDYVERSGKIKKLSSANSNNFDKNRICFQQSLPVPIFSKPVIIKNLNDNQILESEEFPRKNKLILNKIKIVRNINDENSSQLNKSNLIKKEPSNRNLSLNKNINAKSIENNNIINLSNNEPEKFFDKPHYSFSIKNLSDNLKIDIKRNLLYIDDNKISLSFTKNQIDHSKDNCEKENKIRRPSTVEVYNINNIKLDRAKSFLRST